MANSQEAATRVRRSSPADANQRRFSLDEFGGADNLPFAEDVAIPRQLVAGGCATCRIIVCCPSFSSTNVKVAS